jgi:hypothetical protein
MSPLNPWLFTVKVGCEIRIQAQIVLEWGLIPDTKHPLRQTARHEKEPTSVLFHVTISQSGQIKLHVVVLEKWPKSRPLAIASIEIRRTDNEVHTH